MLNALGDFISKIDSLVTTQGEIESADGKVGSAQTAVTKAQEVLDKEKAAKSKNTKKFNDDLKAIMTPANVLINLASDSRGKEDTKDKDYSGIFNDASSVKAQAPIEIK